jgi:hypothetical protein
MVAQSWGKKRVCVGCSVRYYDLKNQIPVCPKCGTVAELHVLQKAKKRTDIHDIEESLLDDIDAVDDGDSSADDSVLTDNFDEDIGIQINSEE